MLPPSLMVFFHFMDTATLPWAMHILRLSVFLLVFSFVNSKSAIVTSKKNATGFDVLMVGEEEKEYV